MKITSVFFLLLVTRIASAETGSPFITNYSPKSYRAHGQNWGIVKGNDKRMYFANTDGILTYNGVTWDLISLPNNVISRSLAIDDLSLFVGAQDEIGVLIPDSLGIYQYQSLTGVLPDSIHNFGDAWNVSIQGSSVYWMTRSYIFQLDKNTLLLKGIITPRTFFHTMIKSGNQLFVNQPGFGLSELHDNTFTLVSGCDELKDSKIYTILRLDQETQFIGTRNNGMFLLKGSDCIPFKTEADEWLRENFLYHAINLKDGTIALASLNDGVQVIDRNGARRLHVNKEKDGLLDNRVWHLYSDEENNLWMATNKGISKMSWPLPFTRYSERQGLSGNVQSVCRYNEKLYVATGNGIYFLKETSKDSKFEKVGNLDTQCWYLQLINNHLLAASNQGVFEIKNGKATRKAAYSTWKILQWNKNPDIVFLGLDDGLAAVQIKNGKYENLGRLPGIDVEARTLAQDSLGNIWIGTTRQGFIQIIFESQSLYEIEVVHYDESKGLPGMDFNLVYQGSEPLFTSATGILEFNDSTRRFERADSYNKYLPAVRNGVSFYTLAKDSQEKRWINNGMKPAYFEPGKNRSEITFVSQVFLSLPEMLIYEIYPEEKYVWFGGPEGLVCYDRHMHFEVPASFTASVNSFVSVNDSLKMGSLRQQKPVFDFINNAISIEYCSGSFINEHTILYQTKLDGFDKNWSDWSQETNRDFTNLREGNYNFKVRAKNIYNIISEESDFTFSIQPPWYRTYWAYLTYIILLGILLYQALRFQKIRKYNKYLIEKEKTEKQQKATEESLRTQLAADFHDELGNKITRISLFSELIKQEDNKLPDTVKNYIERISDNANSLYAETRDFIWQLDPRKDALLETITRIKNFGEEIFTDTEIDFEFENKASAFNDLKLNMEYRKQITRILKEVLHNALKHSKGSVVKFTVYFKDALIVFKISDNGTGIPEELSSNGQGMMNIRNRSAQVNAELHIYNDRGATVELAVKLPE